LPCKVTSSVSHYHSVLSFLYSPFLFFYFHVPFLYVHSFPTRRSSDLMIGARPILKPLLTAPSSVLFLDNSSLMRSAVITLERIKDRKSTRLNSSHVSISYAVFCLKKKKANKE